MAQADDKRRSLRLEAFLEGNFQCADGRKGLIMLTNFSRGGVKAALNRSVARGETIALEVWIPASIIPVFAVGEIVWIKKKAKEWTYSYDAGVRLTQIEPEDRQRIMDFAYEHWRVNKERT